MGGRATDTPRRISYCYAPLGRNPLFYLSFAISHEGVECKLLILIYRRRRLTQARGLGLGLETESFSEV